MTTIPNLNPIPSVTGDDYLITHDSGTNRSGRVSALSLKDYISSQIISDQDITSANIPHAGSTVEVQLDRAIKVVPTFSQLSTTAAVIGQKVRTLGHTQPGVGSTNFTVKSSSGLSSNAGTIAINASLNIAFVMDNQHEACVEHFGAIPGTNCTAAIQAQHDIQGVIRLGTKAGIYYHSGITIGNDVIIESKFKDGVLKVDNSASPARGIDGRMRGRVIIRDIVIDGNNRCTVCDVDLGWTVVGASTLNDIQGVIIKGTKVLGVDLENNGDSIFQNCRIIEPGTSTAVPFKWINSGGNILIRDVVCNSIFGRPLIYGQTMNIVGLTSNGIGVQGLALNLQSFYSYQPIDANGHIHSTGTVVHTIVKGGDGTFTDSGRYLLSGNFGTGIEIQGFSAEYSGTATAANCSMFNPSFTTNSGVVTLNGGQLPVINQVALQPFEVRIDNVSTSSGIKGSGGILSTTALVAGTPYQNFEGGSIQVVHDFSLTAGAVAELQISPNNGTYFTVSRATNTSASTQTLFVNGVVPNGYYYKVGLSGGAIGTICNITRVK